MSPREVTERGLMAMRQYADRAAWQLRRPRWDRADLASALAATPIGRDAASLLARGDTHGAHRALSAHYQSRAPRFVLAPAGRDNITRLIHARFPSAAPEAGRRADGIVEGRLDVLGYRDVAFSPTPGQGIDWWWDPVHNRRAPHLHWSVVPYLDPAVGDHKIIWELNRHQHWLVLGRAWWLTGDPRYRAAFVEQLEGWMGGNPPRTGINWASMLELALRTLSWIWALHLFVESRRQAAGEDSAPWTVDLLLGVDAQLGLVERHLSTYFSPNTHLLGEALALYVAGRALPELRAAARWADTGRRILLEEACRQIHPDGGHVELSTHYHRYTLDFYLLALAVARRTDDGACATRFADAVRQLAGFARALSDRHFRLPQIGDDDGGMLFRMCGGEAREAGPALSLAAALLDEPDLGDGRPHEEVVWMTGTAPPATRAAAIRTSTALGDSGYVVSRTRRGDHLVMDVGRLGYLNAGHAHADALSLTLSVAGQPLLIDPGTGGYTVNAGLRDRLRSTAAHNTLVLDGRSQSSPAGPFHWKSRATARLDRCELTPECDFIEATHDGYGEAAHRRQVLARPGCWVIVDWVTGSATRPLSAHWHLDPAWRVRTIDAGRAALEHLSGAIVWMVTSHDAIEAHTGTAEGLGWYAPAYGALQPTTTLRVGLAAAPPYALVTVFVDGRQPPTFEWLTPVAPAGPSPEPLAFRLTGAGWQDTVVAAGPTLASVDGASFGISGHGRLVCGRAATPATAPTAALAATR